MAMKTKEFTSFGVGYRIKQMSAAAAFAVFVARDADPHPLEALAGMEAFDSERGFVPLNDEMSVNTLVRDTRTIVKPRLVLNGLIKVAFDFNCGFLKGRKRIRVPSYLRSDSEPQELDGEDPVLSALVAEDKATLRELEEYYSLEDAFRIYDIYFRDRLERAKAQHAAMKEAKSKR
ncbi:hypothetical protein EVC45_02405 [Paraburkholderia sp. UYCP14C]|uniref:hypothetical protein n=1 Tax=Paraburkholderia sp. UYCP14C TaxID=2511130 RepID=UPI0010220DD0|nr:hypothetical protein [Paraburkholderia sp. UYCP14C]RZF31324.1 hypothetical protein EVC45_02405 [Paraburkholderia sp. UYCP14C]